MSEVTRWRIGPWIFDSDDAKLRDAEQETPLEHRAARTLAMLCRRRGRTVSRDEILAEVWDGRMVSANSVAVVIADLRRALGDDASEPTYITTVPKRGYRLLEEPQVVDEASASPETLAKRPRRVAGAVLLLSVLVIVTAVFCVAISLRHDAGPFTVVVGQVTNDTGRAQYQPLAVALRELVTNRIARSGRKVILGDTGADRRGGDRVLWLESRLILWNSTTTLSMQAVDRTGRVVWNDMAVAPPDGLASATIVELKAFDQLMGSIARKGRAAPAA